MVCLVDQLTETVPVVISRAILNDPFVISQETENASCASPLETWTDSYGCLQAIVASGTLLVI